MSGHYWPGQGGTTLGAAVSRVRKERLDGGLCNGTWLGKLLEPINGATGAKSSRIELWGTAAEFPDEEGCCRPGT
jgi:hypothetical protein